MIAAEDTALLLLAAGQSRRFGAGPSKLDAVLEGRPLGIHVVETLAVLPFHARLAVVRRSLIDYASHGYATIVNDDPVGDMASSLRLGVRRAAEVKPQALLVVLSDMPRVTAGHIQRLLAAADGPSAIVASADGDAPRPPAVFGCALLPLLERLSGDSGARDIIRRGKHVHAPAEELVDIDTLEQLRSLA